MSAADTPPALVLVSSAGRNGGTLLLRLLDGSPELWVHPIDVVYLTVWNDLAAGRPVSYKTRIGIVTAQLEQLERPVTTAPLVEELGRHWQDIDEEYVPLLAEPLATLGVDPAAALAQRSEWSVRDFLPAFLDATRRRYDARATQPHSIVFKSVETQYVEEYARLYPEMKCLHLVRDPLTNWSSVKRSWSYHQAFPFYWGNNDVLRTFLDTRWIAQTEAALRLVEQSPERHRIVRYEDITARPAEELSAICAWLGAAPASDIEQLTSLGGRAMTEMPRDPKPSKAGVAAPGRIVREMATSFAYDEVVTSRERELIGLATAHLTGRLGYGTTAATGATARLALLARWLVPDASERLHVRSRLRWALEIVKRRLWVARVLARTGGSPS